MLCSMNRLAKNARLRVLGLLALVLWLTGCGALPGRGPLRTDPLDCTALYARYDAAVDASGVRDAQTTRLARYPFLRVDRLHAALRGTAAAPGAYDAWLAGAMRLGREARAVELANLPAERIAVLHPSADQNLTSQLTSQLTSELRAELAQRLDDCAEELQQRELQQPAQRAQLLASAVVPDDYSSLARAAGVYPLAAIPFARGIRQMQAQTRALYQRGEALARDSNIVSYAPAQAAPLAPQEIAAMLQRAAGNALNIPQPNEVETQRLFAAFAPILQVRTLSDADRIGAPVWDAQNQIGIDTARPVVYQLLSHTRAGGDLLLQLNYVFWFPARPKSGALDLLGGKLDGIMWRVTLARDGTPLLYDTIHNCGCYHQFFPSAGLQLKPPAASCDEGAFVPYAAPALPAGARVQLGIDATTHYLFGVAAGSAPASAITYTFDGYDQLRSLPRADGSRRSLFGPSGIVAGSERGERFFFWPMGIESAGAMRQWGRHASAFVGRRHFDDADLIERYFVPVEVK
jgi:hypothetical protein